MSVYVGNVALGSGKTKILVPITPTIGQEIPPQIKAVTQADFDILEWRADYLKNVTDNREYLQAVAIVNRELATAGSQIPILATCRTSNEGGEKTLNEQEYSQLVKTLCDSPDVAAVDVEAYRGKVSQDIITYAHKQGKTVVASYHNFNATPSSEEIVERLSHMQQIGADVLKIAVMPHDAGDVLNLMQATWQAHTNLKQPLITMAMGQQGVLTRAAGQIFGSSATFAMVGTPSAPGQVPVTQLRPVIDQISDWTGQA